jgi:hypothetical protein
MDPIPYSDAEQIDWRSSLPDAKPIFSAKTKTAAGEVQEWVGKPSIWAEGLHHPIRLGMEMFYYALAKPNKLPMPESRRLHLREVKLRMPDKKEYLFTNLNCWGTEFIAGGTLGAKNDPLPDDVLRKVETTFQKDRAQMDAYVHPGA